HKHRNRVYILPYGQNHKNKTAACIIHNLVTLHSEYYYRMKLPIVAYGDPVLRKKAEEIDEDYPNLKELIDNMFETMYAARGVGLAAPQIGSTIRVFVVD